MDPYIQAIKILYKEHEWQKQISAPQDTIDQLRKQITSLYLEIPNRNTLPPAIRKLAQNPNYISVRDAEPKNDPVWDAAVNDYGIGNPPDSIEDMGDIMDERI
jgi:translation initiation factor 2B subunit (eIF-2B alpha/beta/delta family)